MTGQTQYSAPHKGNRGNHRLAVRFDKTDGYVGISQFEDAPLSGRTMDRVLLTPQQVRALVAFLGETR